MPVGFTNLYMNHFILLGDSIFDNGKYVQGGPAVIDQVRALLPSQWSASLLAMDGNTSTTALGQITNIPADATHLVLSIGGNDALACLPSLEALAHTVKQALVRLSQIQSEFRVNYRSLIGRLVAYKLPLMVCTIYDAVPGMPKELRTALGLFNDVILREAVSSRLPVLDLRMICTDPEDYSPVSPIEPSSIGGNKIARSMVNAITNHDYSQWSCRVYC